MEDQGNGPELPAKPRKRPGPKPEPPQLRLLKGRGGGRDSGGRLVFPKPAPPTPDGDPDVDAVLYDDHWLVPGTAEARWDRAHLLPPFRWPKDAAWTPPPDWRPQVGQPDPPGWVLGPDGWRRLPS